MYKVAVMANKKKKKDPLIQIHKKDSNGLFTGKYKTQQFKDKKDKLDSKHKQDKQRGYKNVDD